MCTKLGAGAFGANEFHHLARLAVTPGRGVPQLSEIPGKIFLPVAQHD